MKHETGCLSYLEQRESDCNCKVAQIASLRSRLAEVEKERSRTANRLYEKNDDWCLALSEKEDAERKLADFEFNALVQRNRRVRR